MSGFTRTFTASGAIAKYRGVTAGADGIVSQAAASSDTLLGVSTDVDADTGAPVDVALSGRALLELGDSVTFGERVTVDSDGRGVPLALTGGTVEESLGRALGAGDVGEVIEVLVGVQQITTPA